MTVIISEAAAIALCALMGARVDAGSGPGKINIYAGARPANVEEAIAAQTLLASIVLPKPSFGAPTIVNHVAVANVVNTASVTPTAAGTAAFYRVFDSNNLAQWDGSITASGGGGDMEVNSTAVVLTEKIMITAIANRLPTGQ